MDISFFQSGSVGAPACSPDNPCAVDQDCFNGRCVPRVVGKNNSNTGLIVGAVAGGASLLIASIVFGVSTGAKIGAAGFGALAGGFAGEFVEHPFGRGDWKVTT